jgi:hypothetical protein
MCAEKSEGASYGMEALALGGLTETGLLLATFRTYPVAPTMSPHRGQFRTHCGKSANSITSSHLGKCCALVVSTTLELARPRHALRCYPYAFCNCFP